MLLAVCAFAETNKIVLAPTTSADQSDQFTVGNDQLVTVTFTGTVGVGETADIEISPDGGSTWVADSTQLTDTELIRVIVGPGRFRVNKGATVAAAGVVATYGP